MVILTLFLVGLQTLIPASVQALITSNLTDIAPEAVGRVIEVPVDGQQPSPAAPDHACQHDPATFAWD